MSERFSVEITVSHVDDRGGLVYVYGLDADGFEVIATVIKRDAPTVGTRATIMGHDIYAYSGEYGAWGPASLPVQNRNSNGSA